MENNKIQLAVIGVGAMGSQHAKDIQLLPNVNLAAVCDLIPERAEKYTNGSDCKQFKNYQEMINTVNLDGVIIATPHYDHTPIAIDCFQKGIHVLTEKPIAAHLYNAKKMISAYEKALKTHPNLKFAIMFQQRTYGSWIMVKKMLDEGKLGKIVRATWIITNWFRTQRYYDHGDWRATWHGEGGGVLLNQCPHNLDLFQWFFGMPMKLTGFAQLGKYHSIEVEDEVTAYMEYENGMIGHFITSTAESPGTNRLEIIGEKGKLVVEDELLTFWENKKSMLDQIQTSPDPYKQVEFTKINVPYVHHGGPGHDIIIQNFVRSIQNGESLIVPGVDGVHQLQLGNAIMLSSFLDKPVNLPIDEEMYKNILIDKIRNSKFQKIVNENEIFDISGSFGN